ncbi:3,4-dihydroxy-2-butanone-4-phosphate synthase [Amycolatopsis pithecellobii]|uniref:3,4-dihydroxy-2-butanone-4-phosphate synthase n=1 Tax=Amycolatopsis pithecellobii TaxID=664692 RepID=A0A6N7Z3U9_9PSEU|nr:3,4-dihydroxy-2-butanone-4-phosphate synthase [Amycolatopsis pithecellobii]MTD53716.1 bifunctional 3,4-dihydroxy-2-butanone-4-phosphate synthase/GTP cyclohydrolase II [Amycolatopsis pithecellobii]
MTQAPTGRRPPVSAQAEIGPPAVREAIAAFAQGMPVVIVDSEHDENGGDLVFAAECATPQLVAVAVRYGSGFLCVAITESDADRLELPAIRRSHDPHGSAYTVTVDAREAISTGISATDRAITLRTLADPNAEPSSFTRPGHVVPLRASAGGVLQRPGAAEAAVDLAVLAGRRPSAALCKLVSENDPRELAQGSELRRFAQHRGFPLISVADLRDHRLCNGVVVAPTARTNVRLAHADFTAVSYHSILDEREHIAFVLGNHSGESVPVRIQRECLIGDVFGSHRCDCADSTHQALATIAAAGHGVLIYLRSPVNTSVLGHRPAATIANRDTAIAAGIVRDLDISSVDLLTPYAAEADALARLGIRVATRTAQLHTTRSA